VAPVVPSASGHPRLGQLVLVGAGTTVRVDGVARGPCPVRLSVPPGAHSVEFTFPATGESQVETVSVNAEERSTLRADFTGARPSIRLER
jgi:hypothetical protein